MLAYSNDAWSGMVHQAEQVWQYASIQNSLGLSIVSCDYVTKSSQCRKLYIVQVSVRRERKLRERGERRKRGREGGRKRERESERRERRKHRGKMNHAVTLHSTNALTTILFSSDDSRGTSFGTTPDSTTTCDK